MARRGQLARIHFLQRPTLPGTPDQGLPGGEGEYPDQGLPPEEELPEYPSLEPPVGIWPPPGRPGGGPMPPLPPQLPSLPIPPTAEHPIAPIPPGSESPEQPLPPGTVWPPSPIPPRPEWGTKTLVLGLLYVTGLGWKWRWVVIEDKPGQLPVLPERPQPKR